MKRLHTADWKSRTAARLPGVLARILPDAKAFAMRVLGRHPNNFAEHRLHIRQAPFRSGLGPYKGQHCSPRRIARETGSATVRSSRVTK